MAIITPEVRGLINSASVAHMATADPRGRPHVVPICFAYDGECFYSALDSKPKKTSLTGLRRVRNILSNPTVALLLDHYEENWSRLWYLLVTGNAQLLSGGDEYLWAVKLLREKYPQYLGMDIDKSPLLKITPDKVTYWGKTLPSREHVAP